MANDDQAIEALLEMLAEHGTSVHIVLECEAVLIVWHCHPILRGLDVEDGTDVARKAILEMRDTANWTRAGLDEAIQNRFSQRKKCHEFHVVAPLAVRQPPENIRWLKHHVSFRRADWDQIERDYSCVTTELAPVSHTVPFVADVWARDEEHAANRADTALTAWRVLYQLMHGRYFTLPIGGFHSVASIPPPARIAVARPEGEGPTWSSETIGVDADGSADVEAEVLKRIDDRLAKMDRVPCLEAVFTDMMLGVGLALDAPSTTERYLRFWQVMEGNLGLGRDRLPYEEIHRRIALVLSNDPADVHERALAEALVHIRHNLVHKGCTPSGIGILAAIGSVALKVTLRVLNSLLELGSVHAFEQVLQLGQKDDRDLGNVAGALKYVHEKGIGRKRPAD